jgi:hypothetical protein
MQLETFFPAERFPQNVINRCCMGFAPQPRGIERARPGKMSGFLGTSNEVYCLTLGT